MQNAGRAELFALVELAKRSTGDIRVYCDNLSVVKGSRKAFKAKRKSASLDLWAEYHDAVMFRGGTIDVRWTKGHLTQAQCQDMVLTDVEVYLNMSADFFAGKVADA
eukprot:2531680-Pyramimonas_sp.AAC.1